MTKRLTPSVTDWLLIIYSILLQHLYLCYSSCVQSIVEFLYGQCERLFITDFINKYFTRQIFYKRFLSGYVLHGSVLQFLLEHSHFWNIYISQGSVATHLRCGGIFKYEFVANLPQSLPIKEFWKSVNIWESYGKRWVSCFFDSECTRINWYCNK